MQRIDYYYLMYLTGNMTKMYHILNFTRDPSTVALYWRNTCNKAIQQNNKAGVCKHDY